METKNENPYFERYYDDFEKDVQAALEDEKDDSVRLEAIDQAVRFLQFYEQVISMRPLAVFLYNRLAYHIYNLLRRTRQVQKKGVGFDEKIKQYVIALLKEMSSKEMRSK